MGLKIFWEYVIDNGWRTPNFPDDEDGNFICPLCGELISRKVEMDAVPEYETVIDCPRCGRVEVEDCP